MTDLQDRRIATVRDHMALEVTHDWDAVIATFAHPRYELLGSGAVFEFPLVLVLLVWLGIISTAFLRKYRRHAIVVIFIIIGAAIVSNGDAILGSIFQ